jgi:hypothetical protein
MQISAHLLLVGLSFVCVRHSDHYVAVFGESGNVVCVPIMGRVLDERKCPPTRQQQQMLDDMEVFLVFFFFWFGMGVGCGLNAFPSIVPLGVTKEFVRAFGFSSLCCPSLFIGVWLYCCCEDDYAC